METLVCEELAGQERGRPRRDIERHPGLSMLESVVFSSPRLRRMNQSVRQELVAVSLKARVPQSIIQVCLFYTYVSIIVGAGSPGIEDKWTCGLIFATLDSLCHSCV